MKRRKAVGLYGWLEGCDQLAVRADRKGWLVVLTLEDFTALVAAAREGIPA